VDWDTLWYGVLCCGVAIGGAVFGGYWVLKYYIVVVCCWWQCSMEGVMLQWCGWYICVVWCGYYADMGLGNACLWLDLEVVYGGCGCDTLWIVCTVLGTYVIVYMVVCSGVLWCV